MSREYPNVFSPFQPLPIPIAHVQRVLHLYSTNPDRTPSLQHFPCPVRATSLLLPMSSKTNANSSADVLSVHHLSPVLILSEYHLSYPRPINVLSLLPIANQNTASCPASIPSLLSMLFVLCSQVNPLPAHKL